MLATEAYKEAGKKIKLYFTGYKKVTERYRLL